MSSRLSKSFEGSFYILMISQTIVHPPENRGREVFLQRWREIFQAQHFELSALLHPTMNIFSSSSSFFFDFLLFLSHSKL